MSKDGGPAFPAHDYVVGNLQADGFQKLGATRGMTLRQWYAGQALAAVAEMMRDNTPMHPTSVADAAFAIADAMIAAEQSDAVLGK